MDDISECHKLLKFLLSIVGLWPYERTFLAYARSVTYTLLMLSAILFQLAAFLHQAVYTQNTIVTFVTNMGFTIIIMYKNTSFQYRIEILRKVCDAISRHRTSITDENERRIIFKNIADVNIKIRNFATSMYLLLCGWVLYGLLTNNYNDFKDGLDIHVKMYYFTDNPNFSYIMHIHSSLFMVFGLTGLIGPEFMAVVFAHHTRTLFEVVRYRVKTAFVQSSGISDFEKDKLTMDKLISATKLHKETIMYAKQLSDCLSSSYFVLLWLAVISLSLNLLRWSCIVFALYRRCNCRWYTASVRTQKLLLFFIHHSTKSYTFLVGGLFTPGFEGFGKLLKMSFSYFTVMYSTPM